MTSEIHVLVWDRHTYVASFKSINVSFAFFKMIVPFIIDTKQLLVLIQEKVQDFGSKNRA